MLNRTAIHLAIATVASVALTFGIATAQEPDDPCGALSVLFGGCEEIAEADLETASQYDLGSAENPVRAGGVQGSRAYLDRLRCPNGRPIRYERVGSFGIGPFGNIIDGYEYRCRRNDTGTIFIDMYHGDHVEQNAPPGLTIVAP